MTYQSIQQYPTLLLVLLFNLPIGACGQAKQNVQVEPSPSEVATTPKAPERTSASTCPKRVMAPKPLPGIRPEFETVEYWLTQTSQITDIDAPVLTPAQIRAYNQQAFLGPEIRPGIHRQVASKNLVDLLGTLNVQDLAERMNHQLAFLSLQLSSGHYLHADGRLWSEEERRQVDHVFLPESVQPQLHVALDFISLHCSPYAQGFYTAELDRRFDRNLCSTIHPQQVVQVVAETGSGLLLARTAYATGWIEAKSPLSPPLKPAQALAFVHGPFRSTEQATELYDAHGQAVHLPFATRLPIVPHKPSFVYVATADGIHSATPARQPNLVATSRALTRRSFLTEAFRFTGQSYGWGGYQNGRDCSQFLMDLFALFDLHLPRHSSQQSLASPHLIEVAATADETQRLALLDKAHRRGIVILHFPNHIMLYLGRNGDGVPMVLHSFSEYLVPCEGRVSDAPEGVDETFYTVDEIRVSTLDLGRGSSRRSFLERIDRITVFAPFDPLEQ